MTNKSHYRKIVCEVCGKEFVPASRHMFRHPKSRKLVCGYNCRTKVEKELAKLKENIKERNI